MNTESDKAVSVITGYVVNIGVAVAVITIFTVQSQGLVDSLRESTDKSEMTVVGDKIANKLTRADRIVRENEGSEGNISLDLPSSLSDKSYQVTIDADDGADDNGSVHVSALGSTINTTVKYNTTTQVKSSTLTKYTEADIEYSDTEIKVVENG